MRRNRAGRLLALAVSAVLVAGCGSMFGGESGGGGSRSGGDNPGGLFGLFQPPQPSVDNDQVPAGRLYNEGLSLLQRGQFRAAARRFEDVDRAHPHTEWARRSILMMAYAWFQAQDYDSAAGAAERFVTLHPGSPDAAYAQYLIGESYFAQIPDAQRDQARSERALAALSEVRRRWPNSEYAQAAERRIIVARDQIAANEMEIGRFYLRQRSYVGAANRFKVVVQNYQTTRHVEEALARLVETYMAMGVVQEAQVAAAVLGHNFPNSQWYRDSYALLESGGLRPREDPTSWITRALRFITG